MIKPVKHGKISPSMMCADFLRLEQQLRTLESLEIEYLHIDIMDGTFVPNIALGTDYVKNLKKHTHIPLDIHLMVYKPEEKLNWLEFGKGDYVSFHYEATPHVHRVIQAIKGRGAMVMLAINPGTPLSVLEDVACDLDGVLLMCVNPGFAGQQLVPQSLDKIRRLRALYPQLDIEVDGNVSFENAVTMRAAGANIFVSGTSGIFSASGTIESNAKKLRKCIEPLLK